MPSEQEHINTRALEIAVATDAVLKQHLAECRDRFLAVQGLIVKGGSAVIALLLTIIGYLVANGGVPTVHH
jgi:hypothetical protein